MENKKIFIDTSYYCSVYNNKDSLYERGLKLASIIDDEETYTSNFILLETYTIISQRVGKQISLEFGEYIRKQKKTKILNIELDLENKSWDIFKEVGPKDISYVDCSTIAVMQEHNISSLVTFDNHFTHLQKQYKFKIIN